MQKGKPFDTARITQGTPCDRHIASLAHLVERRFCNSDATGSNPVTSSSFAVRHKRFRNAAKMDVTASADS